MDKDRLDLLKETEGYIPPVCPLTGEERKKLLFAAFCRDECFRRTIFIRKIFSNAFVSERYFTRNVSE